jgi:hypothetical protein
MPEVVAQYEAELDAAFAQARETGDLRVLTTAVRRWWIEALEWQRDPAVRAGRPGDIPGVRD